MPLHGGAKRVAQFLHLVECPYPRIIEVDQVGILLSDRATDLNIQQIRARMRLTATPAGGHTHGIYAQLFKTCSIMLLAVCEEMPNLQISFAR
eukprot:4116434-Pyramimonas_sp.AAC.1